MESRDTGIMEKTELNIEVINRKTNKRQLKEAAKHPAEMRKNRVLKIESFHSI